MESDEEIKELSEEEYNNWMQNQIKQAQGEMVAGCKGDDCD